MDTTKTALVLIGFQNDYFSPDGILTDVIKESVGTQNVLANSKTVIDELLEKKVPVYYTPIVFSPTYSELNDPQGLMKTIKDVGAFKKGSKGGDDIQAIKDYGDKIQRITGKTGFNAFAGTDLSDDLRKNEINNVVLAGVVTSVCIESTGRAASERGFKVTILRDCTAGRSNHEQDFYCNEIFPLYANVVDSTAFLQDLS